MAIKDDYAAGEKLASADLNDAFKSIKGTDSGNELLQFNEAPAYAGTPGRFITAFPYRLGSLQLYVGTGTGGGNIQGMRRLIKTANYTETSPSTGQFDVTNYVAPLTGSDVVDYVVRVDYQRSDL